MSTDVSDLQARLAYRFNNNALLLQALTHRSFGVDHNERLEFLGDAVLDLLIGEWLFCHCPASAEGGLSQMRASLVCGENLAAIAGTLGLGDYLRLGAGELGSGGRERKSSLANALEALIAAVYLDGGLEASRSVVNGLFLQQLRKRVLLADKDAKTRLQEFMQARQLDLPVYQLIERSGADHAAVFRVECRVACLNIRTQAQAGSRKKAEQSAAEQALKQVELSNL